MSKDSFKILLVEDDRFIAEMYVRSLRKAGLIVDEVVTGPDAITKAKSGEYPLVLLDLMIPDKTGMEVLDEIRADDRSKNVRVIIMTNFDQDDASREEVEKKADGYLIKADITPSELVQIIEDIKSDVSAPKSNT